MLVANSVSERNRISRSRENILVDLTNSEIYISTGTFDWEPVEIFFWGGPMRGLDLVM